MKVTRTVLLLVALSMSLAACGIKGNPESPVPADQTQTPPKPPKTQ